MELCEYKPGKIFIMQGYQDIRQGDMFNTSNSWDNAELAVVDGVMDDRFGYLLKHGSGCMSGNQVHELVILRKNEDETLDVLIGRNVFSKQSAIMAKIQPLTTLVGG